MATVHPPVARAIELVVAALEADGHEVFDWMPTNHKEMSELFFANAFSHGYPIIDAVTETGEPLFPVLYNFKAAYDGSGAVFDSGTQRDMASLRDRFINEYFDRWAATAAESASEMDAILTPMSPWVMPPLKALDKALNVSFTNVYNVLGKFKFPTLENRL